MFLFMYLLIPRDVQQVFTHLSPCQCIKRKPMCGWARLTNTNIFGWKMNSLGILLRWVVLTYPRKTKNVDIYRHIDIDAYLHAYIHALSPA